MLYKAYFKDINMVPYEVDIQTPKDGLTEYELKLAGTPVIVKTESSELYSPIKPMSCTINIMTDGGLFDLYTTDPQSVRVKVYNRDNGRTLFYGYATPCQYGQDWTTWDTLSLECVDLLSSLKARPYVPFGGNKQYLSGVQLICWLLSQMEPSGSDTIYNSFRWYWPQQSFNIANKYEFSSTAEFLESVCFNEANFFDDDDEETPWTCYQVLEELCKFLGVSAVPYNGGLYFIDYLYAACGSYGTFSTWMFDLDGNYSAAGYSKNMVLDLTGYAAGTSEIQMDDLYNYICMNTNRYDIDKLVDDVNEHKHHISITKERNFGSGYQVYTHSHENFWGNTIIDNLYTVYKTYCRMDPSKTRWRHIWWSPRSMVEYGSYYSTAMNGYSSFLSRPENKYINTIGATMLHYASFANDVQTPTTLDWNDVVMFNCMTDTIYPETTNTMGMCKLRDLVAGRYEVPVLKWTSGYELCFSPQKGTSWIVIDAKLWYQQNFNAHDNTNNGTLTVTNLKEYIQTMFPVEDMTEYDPYIAKYKHTDSNGSGTVNWYYTRSGNYYGEGWGLLKMQLKVGDKYWDGSAWTSTASTFYINFSGSVNVDDEPTDAFAYLTWMDAICNTDYKDKVGANGYAVPIQASDSLSGVVELTIYTPRLVPVDSGILPSWTDDDIYWWQMGPVVFMKGFSVDYVYTDTSEWYMNQELQTDDVKYENSTKDVFKYEKQTELKVNSWQEDRPISKSFPIVRFGNDGTPVCEYLSTMTDEFNYNITQAQEYNLIDRQLRHYAEPRKVFNCNRTTLQPPWRRMFMNDALELDNTEEYVVGSQEFDVMKANNRLELIQFGDSEKKTNTQ